MEESAPPPKLTPPTRLSCSLSHRPFWASPLFPWATQESRLQHHLTTSWVTSRPLPG